MPHQFRTVAPGPDDRFVRTASGRTFRPPADWSLFPPGDPALTRRLNLRYEQPLEQLFRQG
jgi:hypothetical protein